MVPCSIYGNVEAIMRPLHDSHDILAHAAVPKKGQASHHKELSGKGSASGHDVHVTKYSAYILSLEQNGRA